MRGYRDAIPRIIKETLGNLQNRSLGSDLEGGVKSNSKWFGLMYLHIAGDEPVCEHLGATACLEI